MIERPIDQKEVEKRLHTFPVTCLLGPRQCGKTTLARQFHVAHFFDLENPRDLASLDQPQTVLENLRGLIVVDEIQKKPELFSLLRYLVDHRPEQKYLILGSASRDLIRQASESLAGRVAYYTLEGLRLEDVGFEAVEKLWLRGAFPRSFLAKDSESSSLWRENYIETFLERDIPQLGIRIPAATLRRFWIMLSHYHGQTLNYSELARSFGISDMTVRHYLDILSGTFMVRLLFPWFPNTKKRVVKSPKFYLCDSGLFHALQGINTAQELRQHPKLGASWEGFALHLAVQALGLPQEKIFFWGSHGGAEVDLFWQNRGKNWAVEFKYADAPVLSKSMQSALQELELEHLWVAYPGDRSYSLGKKVTAVPLRTLLEKLR